MADLFQFEPHGLVKAVGVFRENLLGLPLWRIRPPGFLIRGWSQEMWFRPLLGGGCVDSTDWAEQTNGRNLPPARPRGIRTRDLPLVSHASYVKSASPKLFLDLHTMSAPSGEERTLEEAAQVERAA